MPHAACAFLTHWRERSSFKATSFTEQVRVFLLLCRAGFQVQRKVHRIPQVCWSAMLEGELNYLKAVSYQILASLSIDIPGP